MVTMRAWAVLGIAVVMALLLAPAAARADAAAAWQALREGGVVALTRHALAPGTGDPPGFRLDDCSTQRNLNETGREQARRLGALFRERGVSVDGVWSSAWCRCLETAELLGLGPVTPLPALNSFFETPGQGPAQLRDLAAWLADRRPDGVLVLVTHQVVVTGATGVFPASGATVIARPRADGTLDVIGQIPPP
jgi:phosphohistidine phosphatase SixA